jgi:uncharacterized protein (TIGR03435 family)
MGIVMLPNARRMASPGRLRAVPALLLPTCLALAFSLHAQSPPAQSPTPQWQIDAGGKMAFDVASVKLDKSGERPRSSIHLEPGNLSPPNGSLFSVTGTPLFLYIGFAYNLTVSQLTHLASGSPNWVTTEPFDIEARAQGNPSRDQMRLMMQALLADRFKLAVHRETKQGPVYALVLATSGKTGPQLRPHLDDGSCSMAAETPPPASAAVPSAPSSTSGLQLPPLVCGNVAFMQPSTPGRFRVGAKGVTIGQIADSLPVVTVKTADVPDRPLLDRTGLSGNFDFALEFTPQLPPGSTFQLDESGPTFLEALKEQLGLKLESRTEPIDVLVIDHVEEPSPN